MIDSLIAIFFRRRCPWCYDVPMGPWERLLGGDKYWDEMNRFQKIAARFEFWFHEKIPIWKIGRWWHWRYHENVQ